MNSLNMDISVAAKASFAKFVADTSFDWQKHTQEIAYSQRLSKSVSEIYIGGQPPRDGKISTWVTQVISNPMPIRSRVIDLS